MPVIAGEAGIRRMSIGDQFRAGLHVGAHEGFERRRGIVDDSGEAQATRARGEVLRSLASRLRPVGGALDDLGHSDIQNFPRVAGLEEGVANLERNLRLIDLNDPSRSSRFGSIIEQRSFFVSSRAVLQLTPSWASNCSADMPLECVVIKCTA